MVEQIKNLVKSAAAMLQSGKVPPNTPETYRKDLAKINFMSSKKFFAVFWSVVILIVFYASSVFILFLTAPLPTITVPFVTIFTKTIEVLLIIVSSFLGVQTVVEMRTNSSSNVDLEGSSSTENLNENINENKTISELEHVIEEGVGNAPMLRPFSCIAFEE